MHCGSPLLHCPHTNHRPNTMAGGRGAVASVTPTARSRSSRPTSVPQFLLLLLLLLACSVVPCARGFLVPSAPSLSARIGVLLQATGQDVEHEQGQRRPWRQSQQLVADRRDVLAAGAGLVAAGSWVVRAGAAAPATARAPVASTTGSGKEAFLCDDAISHLRDRETGKEVYLIGTAHISNASAQLVRTAIRSVKPQTVMLELDEGRVQRVNQTTGQPPQGKPGFLKMALTELTRPGTGFRERLVGVGAVVVGQVISGLYKTLDKMGFVSGQEFAVAMEEARAVGAGILLGDRNVQVTLRRLSEALSQSDLVKIREIESPTRSPAAKELAARGLDVGMGADAQDIAVAVEALKERASVRKLMGALKQELPEVYQAMIAERDEYMAQSLRDCPSKTIVAVVGMGHMDGIERSLAFDVLPCRLGGLE